MKKLALTSLLAVFAVSGAHAANVIDGNPLYMPKAGHFYSVTALGSSTNHVDIADVTEEFGYGITNKLAISGTTSLIETDWFDEFEWNNLSLTATYRALDMGAYKADLFGGYSAGGVTVPRYGHFGALMTHDSHDTEWFDKDNTLYTWTVGGRAGYTTGDFTIAGHLAMVYFNEESFNWGDAAAHLLVAGIDTQTVLNNNLSLLVGAEYSTVYEDYSDKLGWWELTFGANYNIDATKYLGVYITKDIAHNPVSTDGQWEVQDGFGFGAKFGIDF